MIQIISSVIFLFGVPTILFLISYYLKSRVFYYTSLGLIVLLLIILSRPNHSHLNSNPNASVRSNIHTFQTMLEIYATDWGGYYPNNIGILFKEANKKKYWRESKNPFRANYKAYDNLSNIKKPFKLESSIFIAGTVYYQPIIKDGKITQYFIYGTDKDNKLIFDKKNNEFFTLTNQ